MPATHTFAFALGAVAAVVPTWALARWFYGRRLRAWTQRSRKAERCLDGAMTQAQEARRTIESLQRQLSEAKRAAVHDRGSPVAGTRRGVPSDAVPTEGRHNEGVTARQR